MPTSPTSALTSPHPLVQQALAEHGYLSATAVQQQALPPARQGRDVVALAPTGSGKTLAFVLPLLERWLAAPVRPAGGVSQLVMAPTRELAMQTAEVFASLTRHWPRRPKVVVAIGGVSVNPQMMALRGGADVVVGTPGRLLDLHASNALSLAGTGTVVLDEADRLLDAGFADEVAQVLQRLSARRQSLLFTATFAPALEAMVEAYLGDPVRVDVRGEDPAAASTIIQRAIRVDNEQRARLLIHLLNQQSWPRALVFVASRRTADNLVGKLAKVGIPAHSMHGEHSNGTRVRVLREFEGGALRVMVATDVAARGLDMAQLPVVINFDLPRATEDYTHRIGRSGRAGQPGSAISFVDAASEGHFRLIEKRQRLRVEREVVAGFEPTEAAPAVTAVAGDNKGGIKGKRPSRKDRLRAAAAGQTPAG